MVNQIGSVKTIEVSMTKSLRLSLAAHLKYILGCD